MGNEIFVLLAGAFAVAAVGVPLGLVFLLLRQREAARQLRELEARLGALEGRVVGPAAEVRPAVGEPRPPAPPEEAVAATVPETVAEAVVAAAEPPAVAASEAPVTGPPPPPAMPTPPAASEPPSGPSLEERFGARLPVWIGAIALVLAGAFLVKYTVDQGWLGPAVRLALAVLFGVALLATGELFRRSSPRVAQGLSAAGIADLFIAFYAGVNVYGLIVPWAGFLLMGLTTATAVALSLRQGVMVAAVGLVGGFLTPRLLAAEPGDVRVLFGYLLMVELGLLAVARKRQWRGLAALNLAAVLLWGLVWATREGLDAEALWLGLFLLASVAAFLASAFGRRAAQWGTAPFARNLALGALGGALLVASLASSTTAFRTQEWIFVAILAAGCVVLARLREDLDGLAWLAALAVAALLGLWAIDLQPGGWAPGDSTRFLATAAILGLALAGGAYAANFGSRRPARWAALAAGSGLAIDLLAYWGARQARATLAWGWIELVLAALYVAAALPVVRRRAQRRQAEEVLAALAVAATALVALAVPMELERQWLTVAWALEVAALVWLAGQLAVPVLARLAGLLAGLVGVRLLANPLVLGYPAGEHPLLSWILYGYGVPAVALLAATVMAARQGRRKLSVGLGWLALGIGVAFLALAVRQYFHPGALAAPSVFLAELGVLTVAWLLLGGGLLANEERWDHPALAWGGRGVVTLALGESLLAQGLIWNPAWSHLEVGETLVWNALLLAYGAPALLLAAAARRLTRREGSLARLETHLLRAWGLGALLHLFLLVSLEVRQAFRGTFLDRGPGSQAEGYAYSAAWVLLGIVLLLVGLARRWRSVRAASLAVMLLAVGKVFLYDTAKLSDLYRVFSFLGLGLSLLLLAYLYQRFVFRRRE